MIKIFNVGTFFFSRVRDVISEIVDFVITSPLKALSIGLIFQNRAVTLAQTLDTGLIAYYPFDTDALNKAQNNYHGSVFGATLVPGAVSMAYQFDGIDDYIEIPSHGALEPTTLTVSLWARFETNVAMRYGSTLISTAAWNGRETGWDISHVNVGATIPSGYYTAFAYGWGAPNSYHWNGVGKGILQPDQVYDFSDNQWRHYVATLDNQFVTLSINGNLLRANLAVGYHLNPSMLPLRIGNACYGGVDQFLRGAIDEVRIYNRALSQSEIAALYQRDLQFFSLTLDTGLVAYYPFDTDALNKAQNNYHGSVFGATLVPGPVGMAYQFDGIDDYIEIPSHGALEFTTLTVSLWARFETNFAMRYGSTLISTAAWNGRETGWDISHVNVGASIPSGYYTAFAYGWGAPNGYHWNGVGKGVLQPDQVYDFSDNQWRHYVATLDNQFVTLSINGSLLRANSAVGYHLNPSMLPLRIGNACYGGVDQFLRGAIDEVRIYNRALSQSEIAALYQRDLQSFSSTVTPLPSSSSTKTTLPTSSTVVTPLPSSTSTKTTSPSSTVLDDTSHVEDSNSQSSENPCNVGCQIGVGVTSAVISAAILGAFKKYCEHRNLKRHPIPTVKASVIEVAL